VTTVFTVYQTPQARDPWHHVDSAAKMLKLHGEWEFRVSIPEYEKEDESHPKAG